MRRLRILLLSLTALAASLVAASAAPAEQVITSETAPTRVAAWRGTIMWSQLDKASGAYQLVKSVGGAAPVKVAVPQRSGGPFDIDLGTNRSGATYAVYTRDGDLYRLNVATGAEAKVTKLSSPTMAERDPTIQRGEIAFLRRDHGYDQLRVGNTTSASTGSRLVVKKRHIDSAELAIKQVAYVEDVAPRLRVHVRNLRTGRDQVVYTATSGGANFVGVTKPSYDAEDNAFVWARTNIGAQAGNRIVRYRLSGSKLAYAQGSPRYASSAWVNPELGVATSSTLAPPEADACDDGDVHYCYVAVTGPLSFTLKP